MTMVPTKTAAQDFYRVLKDADAGPVVISRYGQPRAVVVSIRRFRFYEKMLKHLQEEAAMASLAEALERVCEGRLGLANRAVKKAAELGGDAQPDPGKDGP